MFRLSGYGQILYTFKSFVTWLLKIFGELARTSNRFWAISDIWDFPTKLQHFGEMAITSLLRYFGEISEISTHYNDITFLKFRGNIRNLAVSIEVLQTCLKFWIFPRNITNFNWHTFQHRLKISEKTSQFLVFCALYFGGACSF